MYFMNTDAENLIPSNDKIHVMVVQYNRRFSAQHVVTPGGIFSWGPVYLL